MATTAQEWWLRASERVLDLEVWRTVNGGLTERQQHQLQCDLDLMRFLDLIELDRREHEEIMQERLKVQRARARLQKTEEEAES